MNCHNGHSATSNLGKTPHNGSEICVAGSNSGHCFAMKKMSKPLRFGLRLAIAAIGLVLLLSWALLNREQLGQWLNNTGEIQFQTNSQSLRVRTENIKTGEVIESLVEGRKIARLYAGNYVIKVSSTEKGEFVLVETVQLKPAQRRVLNVEFQLVQSRARFDSKHAKPVVAD